MLNTINSSLETYWLCQHIVECLIHILVGHSRVHHNTISPREIAVLPPGLLEWIFVRGGKHVRGNLASLHFSSTLYDVFQGPLASYTIIRRRCLLHFCHNLRLHSYSPFNFIAWLAKSWIATQYHPLSCSIKGTKFSLQRVPLAAFLLPSIPAIICRAASKYHIQTISDSAVTLNTHRNRLYAHTM